MTVREFAAVMRGRDFAERQAWSRTIAGAWHAAFLTAYAPKESRRFQRLDRMIGRITGETPKAPGPADWKADYDRMMAYVKGMSARGRR